MKKTALVIMAAGIGSRFGKGIKQLAPVGPNGEILMEYAIYDALQAGFDKVVFIIRRDLKEAFRDAIGRRIETVAEVEYVYQEREDLPEGFSCPKERTKPWGTGQAVLACRHLLQEPFAVINADDYYGKEAFEKVHQFLTEEHVTRGKLPICMAGFVLGNTLSENGAVTRGICRVDDRGRLAGICETRNIKKTANGAVAEGADGVRRTLDPLSLVSMNMWGLTPAFMEALEAGFVEFLKTLSPEDLTKEYLLPEAVDTFLQKDMVQVEVLQTKDTWFGMTYQEDKELAREAIGQRIAAGAYPEKLYG